MSRLLVMQQAVPELCGKSAMVSIPAEAAASNPQTAPAETFVPSRGDSVCRAGIMRLAAQARKYHLGMVFATQNPREIENTIIGNCSTHFYGKANSSTAIAVIREQIALRGGTGQDVPTLKRGQFYAYNADLGLQAPAKLQVPMCLSEHPKNPLTEETILQLARDSARQRVSLEGTVKPGKR